MTPQDRYRAYKGSEIRWLPDLPAGWAVTPLKYLVSHLSRGESPTYSDADSESENPPTVVINQACVQWGGLRLSSAKYQPPHISVGKGLLQRDDVLINSTGTGTLGRVQVFRPQESNRPYMADSHVTVVRTQRSACEPRFLAYLLSTPLYQGFVYSAITSGATNQIELSRDGLARTPCIEPPIEEQITIANVLEHETARIDSLIAKQERSIELLQEKRQAVIFEQVMRGIRQDVALVKSPVSWLPAMPAHWATVPLKRLVLELHRGKSPTYSPNQDDESDYTAVVNQACVQWSGLQLFRVKRQPPDIPVNNGLLRYGDLLLNSTGTGTLGRVQIFRPAEPERVYMADSHITIVRTDPGVSRAGYLAYLLSTSLYQEFMYSAITAGATNQIELSREGLARMPCVRPPFEEQEEIVAFLDDYTAKVDELIAKQKRVVDLMLEHRTALISAAVTGQIDVRGWETEATPG